MPHHTPPTQRGGDGARGVGGVGWGIGGWGIRKISCTYAYIHTCWYQGYGKRKIGNSKNPYQIQPFSIIPPAKLMKIWRAVDEIGLGPIYPYFFLRLR